MGIAILLHVVAAAIWVGGMFFAYTVLRPVAAAQLEPPARLTLWDGVFSNFFPWVWISIGTILVTGLWVIFSVYGGFKTTPLHVHAMFGSGIIMMLLFFYVYFAPYRRLKGAVAGADWPTGGQALGQIRMLVGINTLIGLLTLAIGAGGRYLIG